MQAEQLWKQSTLMPHMETANARSGVVLMHTPEPARLGAPLLGGMSPAWAVMESLNRAFSAEWARYGVRAVCLRTTGMEETPTIDVVFGLHAKGHGITQEEFTAAMTHRNARPRWWSSGRWPPLWPPIGPRQ